MKTIRTDIVGGAVRRIVETKDGLAGVVIKDDTMSTPIRGDNPEAIWAALEQQLDRSGRNYIGMDGAIARFLRVFPQGYEDPAYLAKERDYKVVASEFLRRELPVEAALDADATACAAAARAFGKTNLLSPFEQSRVREVLKGPAGPAFVRAAARLAVGDLAALDGMAEALKPSGAATWPVMTYLPLLWSPETHVFLKPTVTLAFAERVGHRFPRDYAGENRAVVYRGLLDLRTETLGGLASLTPRDGIDLQGFIWVVGAYDDKS